LFCSHGLAQDAEEGGGVGQILKECGNSQSVGRRLAVDNQSEIQFAKRS